MPSATPQAFEASPAIAESILNYLEISLSLKPYDQNNFSTVSTYLNNLTLLPADRLFEEPSLVASEESRITQETQKLIVDHYKVLIKNTHVIATLSTKAEKFQNCFDMLIKRANMIKTECESYKHRNNTLLQQMAVIKLSEDHLPHIRSVKLLLDMCMRNGMYSEMLKLLNFLVLLYDTIKSHESLFKLQLLNMYQLEWKRSWNFMLKYFEKPSCNVTNCVRVMGALKKLYELKFAPNTMETLEICVLKHLSVPIEILKTECETLFNSDPLQALSAGASLIKKQVFNVFSLMLNFTIEICENETNGQQVFGNTLALSTNNTLICWITAQILWLLSSLKQCLVPPYYLKQLKNDYKGSIIHEKRQSLLLLSTPSLDALNYFRTPENRFDFNSFRLLYQQLFHTSQTFKMFHVQFFTLATGYFDIYLEEFIHVEIYQILQRFSKNLRTFLKNKQHNNHNHDLPPIQTQQTTHPSLAYDACENFSDPNQDAPLISFSRELVGLLNKIRLFPLKSIGTTLSRFLTSALLSAIDILHEEGQYVGLVNTEKEHVGYWEQIQCQNNEIRVKSRHQHLPFLQSDENNFVATIGEAFFSLCICFANTLPGLLTKCLAELYPGEAVLIDDKLLRSYFKGMYITNPLL